MLIIVRDIQISEKDLAQVNRKEFKGLIPIVETSSHENINVDQAFFLGRMVEMVMINDHIGDYDLYNDHGQ